MRILDRSDALPLLAALPVLATFAWWMADSGGYAPAAWMPGLLVVAVVLSLVMALTAGRPSRPAVLAIAALGAYTLWSFASIVWAAAPGVALEGSQRTLLYLLCFASFALLPWTPRALLVFSGLFVLIITMLGVVVLIRLGYAADPSRFFFQARLAEPLGYPNATAALWTIGALGALVLAARPEVLAWLRPFFLGACGLLLGLALTTQSRGWLFTLPMVLLVMLLLVPGRARLILFAVPVAGALAVASGDLLAPYTSAEGAAPAEFGPTLSAAFGVATQSLALVVGLLIVVGALAVWADQRICHHLTLRPRASRALAAAVLGCVAVASVGAAMAATDGRPVERIDQAWAQFENYEGEVEGASRFSAIDSNRYDVWGVAVDSWREHPVGGLGQDNFVQTYVRERSSAYDEPRWVHSLPLRLLAHTGLVGALLFALFMAAVVWAATAAWWHRGGRGAARVAGAVALLPAVVWIAHGSVDWLWEYPALSGPALSLAGAATALSRPARDEDRAPARRAPTRVALAGATALACALIILPSYIADRLVRSAAASWPANPGLAFERLERARALNPLDAKASLVEGLIAVRSGRMERARVSFARAASREPRDWLARFELGLIAGERRDWPAALEHLQAAQRLNPRERLVFEALKLARERRTMSFGVAEDEFARRARQRVQAAPLTR